MFVLFLFYNSDNNIMFAIHIITGNTCLLIFPIMFIIVSENKCFSTLIMSFSFKYKSNFMA